MDVQNDLYFYVAMVLPTLPQIPVKLLWGVTKAIANVSFSNLVAINPLIQKNKSIFFFFRDSHKNTLN